MAVPPVPAAADVMMPPTAMMAIGAMTVAAMMMTTMMMTTMTVAAMTVGHRLGRDRQRRRHGDDERQFS
jgi:hypothetical protein